MIKIGVLTSGGDSPGMNAAVRAVTRMAIRLGADVVAIREGYQGMVQGGDCIQPLAWSSVGGCLHVGGTIIGTARSARFREREGRLCAAENLLRRGVDRLVVIGGDGSLSGALILHQEWQGLVAELLSAGRVDEETARAHPHLAIIGLPGSIDNDLWGTDVSIGADTALHRIVEAVDSIFSTASSHQRTFVIEVMGRNCGYLALMAAMAIGAEWVMVPEVPPPAGAWAEQMCQVLQAGRQAGRRASLVLIAEGARDDQGQPITSQQIQTVLNERLGEDVRVTILGHVQRGGSPSVFDRNLSSILGAEAARLAMEAAPEAEPVLVGLRGNRCQTVPLVEALERTREQTRAVVEHDYEQALRLRGASMREAWSSMQTIVMAAPRTPGEQPGSLRLGVLNAGPPAPGMNMAVRAAVRLLVSQGHQVLGVRRGFRGLLEGDLIELDWMSVTGWSPSGGSELGTVRYVPSGHDLYAMARQLEEHKLQGLLVIGGLSGYETGFAMLQQSKVFPSFNIPIVCVPASIDNNLPGTELSIGSDTALNNVIEVVDKIKQSAVATQRCFVVEVMGGKCGYLALMSGLATGAEKIYLPEEGMTAQGLLDDLKELTAGFRHGKRLGLVIRNEHANTFYTTPFVVALFEEEGGDLFEVRQAILGHLQQGGNPSPFDRLLAIRLVRRAVEHLLEQARESHPGSAFVGMEEGKITLGDLADYDRLVERQTHRPKEQWWLHLRELARQLSSAPK